MFKLKAFLDLITVLEVSFYQPLKQPNTLPAQLLAVWHYNILNGQQAKHESLPAIMVESSKLVMSKLGINFVSHYV